MPHQRGIDHGIHRAGDLLGSSILGLVRDIMSRSNWRIRRLILVDLRVDRLRGVLFSSPRDSSRPATIGRRKSEIIRKNQGRARR